MMALNRVNKMGLKYHLMELPDNKTRIKTGDKEIIVNAEITRIDQAWYYWNVRGEYIQVAFDFLSDDEREFLITGLTKEEWEAMWARINADDANYCPTCGADISNPCGCVNEEEN
jgi:hypothetical protein